MANAPPGSYLIVVDGAAARNAPNNGPLLRPSEGTFRVSVRAVR